MGDGALCHILPEISDERLQILKYTNFLAALRSRVMKTEKCGHLPIDLTVDFTTFCQLHCPFCSVGNGTIRRKRAQISLPFYESLLEDIGDALFVVWNFSAGEPLLHPRCSDLVRMGKKYEIFSIISTNLSLKLSQNKIDELLLSGLGMLSISLDGVDEVSYSKYRRGGDFDLVCKNISTLVRRKRELGIDYPIIEWRYLIFEHNEGDVEKAKLLAEKIGVDLLEFYPGYAVEDPSDPDSVRPMKGPVPAPCILGPALDAGKTRNTPSLRRYLTGLQAKQFSSPSSDSMCDWLYFSSMIYPDGSIGPCCVATDQEDDFAFFSRQRFPVLWNNSIYIDARRRCLDGQSSGTICDRCPAPHARRYQFRNRIRSILWNAPDWVLHILKAVPQDFFLPDDPFYMPLECEAIIQGEFLESAPDNEIIDNLQKIASTPNCSNEHLAQLPKLFKAVLPELY